MKDKVLVVGGTGFIGYHVLKNLSKKKYFLYSLSKKKPKKKNRLRNIKYIYCDITKFKDLKKKLNCHFDHIINLSGYIDHSKKKENMNCHFHGCKNLVSVFKKKKIKTFIQVGSSLEYGNQSSPQSENKKCKPRGSYGLSKLKASDFLKSVGKIYDFPYIILRPYQIYGPKQKNNRLIPQTIEACLKNKKFDCSLGLQKRDFLYVGDFVELIKKIFKQIKLRKEIFNVGSGKPVSVKQIIKMIQSIIGLGKPQFGKITMRKDEINSLYPSIKKSKKKFNWTPKIKLKAGIKKTIQSYV